MCAVLSSCGLFSPAMTSGTVTSTPNGAVVNPLAATLSSIAPNHRNLKAQEDPGTGLYGFLNEFGVWVISPKYTYASDFHSDLGLAVVQMGRDRYGAIDVYGQTVIQFNFLSRYTVQEAMSSMLKGRYVGIDLWPRQDVNTELYGYLDYYGNWYIQPQFMNASNMSSDGFAVVQFQTGKWGAIDRRCNIIVQPNFTSRYDAATALNNLLRR